MKKFITVATSAALVLSFQTPAVAALPKPSAKCSSVGIVYEDLKCTKVKTKKIWVAQKFSPWSSSFNLAAMSKASQDNFTKWVAGYSNVGPVEYYTNVEDQTFLKSYLYSAKAIEALNPDAKIFFAKDQISAKSMMDSKGIKYSLNNGVLCYENVRITGCNFLESTGVIILNNDSKSVFTESILPHENFHSIQSYLGKYNGYMHRSLPVWFVEGSADYFGYMSYANANKISYYSIREMIDLGQSTSGKLSEYDSYSSNPYNIGRVAIEYLSASKGIESVVQVFSDYGNGISFEESFNKQFGITLTEFYDKFFAAKNKVNGLVK
jgi:hypothetical protein